jgi:tetratricopeptide (TPR) repeat protein
MYQRDQDWGNYLALRESTDHIVAALERRTPQLIFQDVVNSIVAANRHEEQIQSLQSVAENQRWMSFQLDQGFGKLIATQQVLGQVVQNGFGATARQMDKLGAGVQALQASFDWWMGQMVWKLETQSDTLKGILDTLQAPLDAQAKELRRRAEFAYQQGWYEESLSDFLESERKNYQDFSIHFSIGNIHLYQQQPPNLAAARDYYLKAGKYATPKSAYHAALGYMYAGFVSYMLRDDAAAVENGRRAVTLDPTLAEAWYNLAKFAAAAGKGEIVASALEQAVTRDRNYAVKARVDPDFARAETAVQTLLQRLTANARRKAEDGMQAIRARIEGHTLPAPQRGQIESSLAQMASLCNQGTLFACQDALAQLANVQRIVDALRLDELAAARSKLLAEVNRLAGQAQNAVSDLDWRNRFTDELNQLTGTIRSGDLNECAKAQTALSALGKQLTEKVAADRQRAEKLREYHELNKKYIEVSQKAQELKQAVIAQSVEWGRRGRCVDCGEPLSLVDKARGLSKCGDCRYLDDKYKTLGDHMGLHDLAAWNELISQRIPKVE